MSRRSPHHDRVRGDLADIDTILRSERVGLHDGDTQRLVQQSVGGQVGRHINSAA
ncbi:Uncharacterised protein [Mycobacteroides abscessus subsp. abscessus]|nr:Uncharacterised protein [Mycobacteroides abscessus subsp. abscessus]